MGTGMSGPGPTSQASHVEGGRVAAGGLLQALRTRLSMDASLYLNQAWATYPGGVSELDEALHLLPPPDEDLEVG